MNTTASVVLTGVVVGAGHIVREKKVPSKVFVGVGFLAIALAAMNEVNAELASQFAVLILVGAVLMYGVDIGNGLKGALK